jgi:hypothetical protein
LQRAKATVIVYNPRKNRLLRDGNKSDRIDARKLAQLLRAGLLSPVYHGEHGTRDGSVARNTMSKERLGESLHQAAIPNRLSMNFACP